MRRSSESLGSEFDGRMRTVAHESHEFADHRTLERRRFPQFGIDLADGAHIETAARDVLGARVVTALDHHDLEPFRCEAVGSRETGETSTDYDAIDSFPSLCSLVQRSSPGCSRRGAVDSRGRRRPREKTSPHRVRQAQSSALNGFAASPHRSRAMMPRMTLRPPSAPTSYDMMPRSIISSGVSFV